MGFITPVILRNDAMDAFRKDPKAFGEAILEGVDKANMENGQVDVPFKSYSNYISVEKSRHADHHALFLSMGNCVTVIGEYERDWERLLERNPEFANRLVKEAESILKFAKRKMKERKEKEKSTEKV